MSREVQSLAKYPSVKFHEKQCLLEPSDAAELGMTSSLDVEHGIKSLSTSTTYRQTTDEFQRN